MKKNRILLVQPPYKIKRKTEPKKAFHPLGLGYIAAVLEQAGYHVGILDCIVEGWNTETKIQGDFLRIGITPEEIKTKILDFSPDVVGISSMFFTQADNAHEIAKLAKQANKNVIVVMGGGRPTVAPEQVLADSNVDLVVLGEGEHTILDILKALNEDSDFSGLDGVAFRENNKIKILPKTKFIENLDEIPFPARHLLPMDKYLKINVVHGTVRRTPVSPIISSRGCPGGCTYCGIDQIWGKRFRGRSAENVAAEIEHLVNKYGVKELHFEDDNLVYDSERADRLFSIMIEKKLDLIWSTPNGTAIMRLDNDLLFKAKASGCYEMALGIESGDPDVRKKIIKKPLKEEKIKEVVKTLQDLDIDSIGFFIIGLPGEKKDQIEKTIQFSQELGLSGACFSIATPYPGTKLYDICKVKNYLEADFHPEKLRFVEANIKTPDFTSEEIRQYYEDTVIVQKKLRLKKIFRNPAQLPFVFYKFFSRVLMNPGYLKTYTMAIVNMINRRN